MKKGLCVAGVMLLIFLVTGTAWAGAGQNAAKAVGTAVGQSDGSGESDMTPSGDSAEWTFIFYLAADNEQEAYADATIAQLEAGTAGVPNHPQIMYLIDRLGESRTEVFKVVNGTSELLVSYPEQNTADGAVLENFASYALKLAADTNKVAFIMKSEGLSWRGIGRDNTHDDLDKDGQLMPDQLMPTGDLADALIAAQDGTVKDIDLLVLEGSLMAFIEVVYELRNAAPILLATQSKIQPDGLPWEMVIEDLGTTPNMTDKELGKLITDNHIEYYGDKGNNGVPCFDTSINFAAMTIFDMDPIKVEALRDLHCVWAKTTWPLFDEIYNSLPHARDLSEVGGFGEITDFDYQFDIQTFMREGLRLIAESMDQRTGEECTELKEGEFDALVGAVDNYLTAQDELIIHFRKPSDGFKLNAANGLSIWYPPAWNKYETRDESNELFGSTMYYEDPAIGLDWVVVDCLEWRAWFDDEKDGPEDYFDFGQYTFGSNWTIYLFEYFYRADAELAGDGIGSSGEEPPKTGLFEKIDEVGAGMI